MNWLENKYKNNLGYIPNMKYGQEWSMKDVFGCLPPYNPELFSSLCPRTKWIGTCIEGVTGFCTECGNLKPKIPNTHHRDCSSYLNTTSYPEVIPYLGGCPVCHQERDDSLGIDSSIGLGASVISCSECSYMFIGSVCEEELESVFLQDLGR